MTYKNISLVPKTFHGVKFNPGESHDVNGYINDKDFVVIDACEASTPVKAKSTESKPKLSESKPSEATKNDESSK